MRSLPTHCQRYLCFSLIRLTLIEFLTKPYPLGVREDLFRLSQGDGGGEGGREGGEEWRGVVADVCLYNFLLGHLFAEAAQDVVAKAGHSMDDIAIIGSHGYVVLLTSRAI